MTSAGLLFCVVTRGVRQNLDLALVLERRERHVDAERAVDGAQRQAERRRRADDRQVDRGAGLLERRRRADRSGPASPGPVPTTRPESVPRFGNASAGRVAELRRDAAVDAPLHAERAAVSRLVCRIFASISTCGSGLSSSAMSCSISARLLRQVLDDEHVGALVDLDAAARGDHARLFEQLLHVAADE